MNFRGCRKKPRKNIGHDPAARPLAGAEVLVAVRGPSPPSVGGRGKMLLAGSLGRALRWKIVLLFFAAEVPFFAPGQVCSTSWDCVTRKKFPNIGSRAIVKSSPWPGPRSARRHDGRSAKFRQNVARFRAYRYQYLQVNTRFQHFLHSTRLIYLTEILKIWQKFAKFATFAKFLLNFHENCWFFNPIFCENLEIAAVQKYANLVELEKCCQTHIFLQNFVLIQPRTSPLKICKI